MQTEPASRCFDPLRHEVGKIIVGQARLIDGLLIGLLTDGHVLVEGVPGLAKTLAVKAGRSCAGAHVPARPVHA